MTTIEERLDKLLYCSASGYLCFRTTRKILSKKDLASIIRVERERAAKEAVEEYDKELFLNGEINCVNVTSECRKAALSKYGIKGE